MSKTILIAAHELQARGKPEKTGGEAPIERVKAGDEIDAAAKKRLGLTADDIDLLKQTAAIVEVPVRKRESSADDTRAIEAELAEVKKALAEETKRADDAEARAIDTLSDDDLRAVLTQRGTAIPDKADHAKLLALMSA